MIVLVVQALSLLKSEMIKKNSLKQFHINMALILQQFKSSKCFNAT